jgi:alpha-L-rhamnosidase
MRHFTLSTQSCAVLAAALLAAGIWTCPAAAAPGYAALHTPSGSAPFCLKCEGSVNPVGIDIDSPRLSWKLPVTGASAMCFQTAYQIQAATSQSALAVGKPDLWDSGRVDSADNINAFYHGKPVPSSSTVYWRVRAWMGGGTPCKWSGIQFWDTGLRSRAEWDPARWISSTEYSVASPEITLPFDLHSVPSSARLYICSAGYHTAELNNRPADYRVLEPAQTDFEQRAIYSSYRVTQLLKPGRNYLRISIGNGWYNQDRVWGGMSYGKPALLFKLVVNSSNGTTSTYVSGPECHWRSGPITDNNIYAGEHYDARRVLSAEKSYEAGTAVQLCGKEPVGTLISSQIPPIRATGCLHPQAITSPAAGIYVYDMGQNFAGWARIQIKAPAGTEIRLRFAETTDKSGRVDTASTGVFATGVEQIDKYICSGRGNETWQPAFTYHGYRYIELTGLPAGVKPPVITGIVVHSDVPEAGSFTCSDPMINKIHHAAVWTLISNLHGQPTDCPARERCGWMGDAHACAEMSALNFDMATFWSKYVGDIVTSWKDTLPSQIAPGKRGTGPSGNPDWGAAVVMVPYYRYLYYGDTTELRSHYPLMERFVTALARQAKMGLITSGYGDWCPPGSVEPVNTPPVFTSTVWLMKCAEYTAVCAHVLGKPEEEKRLRALAQTTRHAIEARFYNVAKHTYGSQTSNAMALSMGFCPAGEEKAIAETLNADVISHGCHHTTGIFGSRWLFDALASHGHADTADKLLHQTTYPSIGYLFSLGATTFWECWGEEELDKKWGARSLNHPMQAAYDAYFYQGICGIRPQIDGAGMRHTLISPQMLPGLHTASAACDTSQGILRSSWSVSEDGRGYTFQIRVPANSHAEFVVPEGLTAHRIVGPASIPNAKTMHLTPGDWTITATGKL